MPIAVNIQLPEKGFMRLTQIIGDKKSNTAPIIPVGRTTFLNNVKLGLYPQPIRLGARCVAWKVEDIRALIGQLGDAA